MSGIYLLVLIAIWLFVGWSIFRIWRRQRPSVLPRKIIHIVIGVLLFSLWFGGAFWEVAGTKMYWDAKVREMCAKDGGIKVYETVELPPEMFDKWGMVRFYQPTQGENTLGPDYIFKEESQNYRKQNPTLIRHQYLIHRRSDEKLLGETILYGRGGGSLPGPWHDSSFTCPPYKVAGVNKLIQAVFPKSTGGDKE